MYVLEMNDLHIPYYILVEVFQINKLKRREA